MKATYIFSLIPVIISIVTLWINYAQGSNKNKTGIIDSLASELSKKNANPYVIQVCISRIHSSRPIPYRILNKILRYDNALEIIQMVSTGRRILDLLQFSESGQKITVDYSSGYKSAVNRWISGLICTGSMLFCYFLSVNTMIDLIISVDTMSVKESESLANWVDIAPDIVGLAFSMIMTFIFSWQTLIILQSKRRIKKIKKLLDAGPYFRYRNAMIKNSGTQHDL
ncbi:MULTISPECIES: hypothetical protein [Enterobacteriaceae]|uniref:hypothetical protein n=1 Tax=Enterobacteriaceae TaxID=543 RepID=UPI00125349FB|nr:hypothetical protein [Enterobacter hormaechei]VAE22119.1 Uncharacterised protein [Enterobacter hormaechei]VAE27376.1 Uncharacterised protein [Enterobacter hormaechei]